MQGRVFVVGFDGATFDLIRPWSEQGLLPTFAGLLKKGAGGPLRSTLPPFSAPAWTTFMTGVNPGQHGLYDFVQPRGSTYELQITNANTRQVPSIWRLLSQCGRRVAAVNIPMTYPPESVNGIMIAGFDAPDVSSTYTYPAGLRDELKEALGTYVILPDMVGLPLWQVVKDYLEVTDLRARAVRYLWSKERYDLFAVVFNGSDALQHLCLRSPLEGKCREALLSMYQAYDRFLADLLIDLPEDVTLLVMSDHGATPIRQFVYLDRWLADRGWLQLAEGHSGTGGVSGLVRRVAAVAAGQAVMLLRRYLPVEWRRRLKRYRGLQGRVRSLVASSGIDWGRTQAYTRNVQGIFINLKGRQPEGIVEPGKEYDELCCRISDELLALRDPDNPQARIVDRVLRKEEVFSGPYVDMAPDLYICWTDDAYLARFDRDTPDDSIFQSPTPSEWEDVLPTQTIGVHAATHQRDGILMAWGTAIEPGTEVQDAHIMDLAPTIFYFLDEPVPAHMEGKVLTGLCCDSYLAGHTVELEETYESEAAVKSTGYSEEDEKKIRERLKGLGYLEE